MKKAIKRCVGACALKARAAHRSFTRLLTKRVMGFVVAGVVGYVIFKATGHPIAFLSLLERSLDWVGASMSDALVERESA